MTPDELLQRYPRATLRWLRGRLGLRQFALALHLGADLTSGSNWETGRHRISRAQRVRLVPLLAPQLATEAGPTWLRTLGTPEEEEEPCPTR